VSNQRGRILIVDDDPDWVEAITDFLEEEGYSVAVAENGLAAMEILGHMQPLVVVTDIQMPVMDGRQLLFRIRARDERVPVIVVSGERARAGAGDAELPGAFRVMPKPVQVEELLTAIAAAGARRKEHLPLEKLWRAAAHSTKRRHGAWREFRRAPFVMSAVASAVLILALASAYAVNRRRLSN
jgi:DNA-binding NtrC family response regulator